MKTVSYCFFPVILCAVILASAGCGSSGKSGGDDPWAGNSSGGNTATTTSKIHLTSIMSTSTSITCTWTDPVNSTFDHIVATAVGTESAVKAVTNTRSSVNVSKGTQSYTWTGLTAGTRYFCEIAWSDGSSSYGANTFAFAATSSGTATCQTISTAAELANINSNSTTLAGSYLLMADIDLSSYASWTPIGSSSSSQYSGCFNGNNYTISNLTINTTSDSQGLFNAVYYGCISNVLLEKVSISAGGHTGGLAGYNNHGIITSSYATGSVTGTDFEVGGLVGYNIYGIITSSYATGSVSGTGYVGGLAGRTDCGAITSSYATGSVSGTGYYVGGLAGYNDRTITSSYATGSVTGTGLEGGGLVGYNYGTITSSYYDADTTGYTAAIAAGKTWSAYGTPLSTSLMKTQSSFTGWDFTSVWAISPSINNGYPYLRALQP